MFKKLSIQQIKDKLYSVHGDEIILNESTYVNMQTKCKFIDKEYGEWEAYPNNVLNKKTKHKKRISKINGIKCRRSIENCHELAKQKRGKCLSRHYINANFKYLWECEKNHRWYATFSNVQQGKWCRLCSYANKKPLSKKTKEKISQANSGKNNGMYGRKHTKESKEKISQASLKLWQSEKHRDKVVNHPDRIKWCRQGALARLENSKDERFFNTKPEKEMKKILDELNIKYKHGYSIWDIEHMYQADFYLYDFNIVLEVDGKYWHNYPHGLEIDHIRTNELLNKNYKVLRFWEDEFNIYSIKKHLGIL